MNDAFERDVVQYLTDVYKYATLNGQDDLQSLVTPPRPQSGRSWP